MASGQTQNLQAALAANRKVRDAEYAFNMSVRNLTIDPTVTPAVNKMLTASNNLIAAIDKADASKTAGQFSDAFDPMQSAGQSAEDAEYEVLSELGVASRTPTAHLASDTMPYAVRGSENDGRPFEVDRGANGDGATYANGGYQISVAKVGTDLEDATADVLLDDVKVVADFKLTGSDTTGYVTCRDTGDGGSKTGQMYAGGVSTNGAFYVQILDNRVDKVVNLASGQVDGMTAASSATLTVRLDCIGNYLTLYANDKPVVQVWDDTLGEGRVGVGATTPSGPGTALVTGFDAYGKSTV